MLFQLVQQGTPVVVVALQIASFTYGGLLGGFLLGVFSKQAGQADVITGMTAAMAIMTTLWIAQRWEIIPQLVDTLWFSLLGSAITLIVGSVSARLRGATA
jgi:hypothetical protein